jgi:Cdc6-like AAA superfamily ATPase
LSDYQKLGESPLPSEDVLLQCFSPSSPISDMALFAGRKEQRREITSAINQTGQHVIVFGERGVGKTSLANVLAKESQARGGGAVVTVRVNCDSKDDFTSVWRKVAAEIQMVSEKAGLGFNAPKSSVATTLDATLKDDVRPQDVRKLLTLVGTGRVCIIVIDEFDRVQRGATSLFADTIKTLSDYAVPATLMLVGVADSVGVLLKEHLSVERALVQVLMPRMSLAEIADIIKSGLTRARMTIDDSSLRSIVRLAQGLPHYAHLLGQNAGFQALDAGRSNVNDDDVKAAIRRAVEKAQESIKSAHYEATTGNRKESIYRQVLLACALARPDNRGLFAAGDVRAPLSAIMGRRYDIPAFTVHLNDFCEKDRGPILEKQGSPRKFRFRFLNPLMQPYVLMNGLSTGLIQASDLEALSTAPDQQPTLPHVE